MNKGIALAVGEYVGIINSDDFYHKDVFQHVIDAINHAEYPIDVFYGDHNVIDENNNTIYTSHSSHRNLKRKMSISHPTCFVRRETYKAYGAFDTSYRITADYELMMRFQSKGCRFQKIENVMASYRVGGASSNNFKCVIEPYQIQKQYISTSWAVRNFLIETGKFVLNATARRSKLVNNSIKRYKDFKKRTE